MAKKWNGDSTASDKLLLLFTILLFNKRSFSLNELCSPSCLNCSKATVLRLLRHLESSKTCVLLHEKKGRESFYSIEHKSLPELAFNPESINLLVLCRDFINHLLPDNMRAELTNVLAILSGRKLTPSGLDAGSLTRGRIDYNPFQEILSTLHKAIRERLVCKICYAARQDQSERAHFFAPLRFLAYHETIYAEGWLMETDKPDKRKYTDPLRLALQRFKSCMLTDISSAGLPMLPPVANNSFGFPMEDSFRATINFAPEAAAYVRERIWSENQILETGIDGSVKLSLEIANSREALAWILSFGAAAQVCEPAWFARAVRRELRKAARNYHKKSVVTKNCETVSGIENGHN